MIHRNWPPPLGAGRETEMQLDVGKVTAIFVEAGVAEAKRQVGEGDPRDV